MSSLGVLSQDNVSIVPVLFKAAGESGILTVYCPRVAGKLLGERKTEERQKTVFEKNTIKNASK